MKMQIFFRSDVRHGTQHGTYLINNPIVVTQAGILHELCSRPWSQNGLHQLRSWTTARPDPVPEQRNHCSTARQVYGITGSNLGSFTIYIHMIIGIYIIYRYILYKLIEVHKFTLFTHYPVQNLECLHQVKFECDDHAIIIITKTYNIGDPIIM